MNTKITAIVVEDERLPRLALLQKLSEFEEQVEVVASTDNYDDALKSILLYKPQLLLLDIQLQGRDALQLLEEIQLSQQPMPYVIFTTAYSDRKYLMSAIKFQAVDYLLKPINKNELALAVAKVAASIAGSHGGRGTQPAGLSGKLTFRTANGRILLHPTDIAYVRADGNYANLFTTNGRTESVMQSLATIETKLDGFHFVRADRSTVVNTELIYKLNTKRRVCTLLTPQGFQIELELSKTAIENLLKLS